MTLWGLLILRLLFFSSSPLTQAIDLPETTANTPAYQTITLLGPTTTITLPPERDNTLYEDEGGRLSNGAGDYLFVGRTGQNRGSIRRGLIKFALAEYLPPEAVILSGSLTLNLSQTSDSLARPITLHPLLADWGESASAASGGRGTLALPGDATWTHAFTPTVLWAAPGGDFVATASAETIVGGQDAPGFYDWGPTPQMTGDLQTWLDHPAANFGWLLVGHEDEAGTSRRFASRENGAAATRPVLMIVYRPVYRLFLPLIRPRGVPGSWFWVPGSEFSGQKVETEHPQRETQN